MRKPLYRWAEQGVIERVVLGVHDNGGVVSAWRVPSE